MAAWRTGAVAGACALACLPALAHPHGSIDCRAAVTLQAGAVQAIDAELRLDAWHSGEALALVRDPATGAVDPGRLARFAFALKLQLGRLGWLAGLQADGQSVPLHAGEPRIEVVGEQVRVQVALAPAGPPSPAAGWSLRCADPTFYWLTAFGTVPVPGGAVAVSDPLAVTVRGCTARPELDPAQAAAAVRWRCAQAEAAFAKSETAVPN